jgi:hypothetical protein
MGTISPVRQPFCSQIEERLLWLKYHPQLACYARSDLGQEFAAPSQLLPRDPALFALGYAFAGTCSQVYPIELKHFPGCGIALVECPDCARRRTLSPRKGVPRFPSHDKRPPRPLVTSQRWAREKTIREVVGGERR